VTVSAAAAGTIGPQFIGLSTDKDYLKTPTYQSSNANMIACFKLINVGVLRFGDGSDDVWTPSGAGRTTGQTSPVDVNALNGFLKAAGCQCIYGLNLGGYGPHPGSYPTTPALAAAEAAYVSQELGSSLYGIEIGNEPDGYINNFWAGQTPTYSVTTLESAWETFQSAIVTQTPGIPIVGPSSGTVSPVVSVWTQPFGTKEGSKLTNLTQHYYRANAASNPSVTDLISYPDTTLTGTFLGPLKTTATSIGKPFRISECNSYYNGGASGVSNAYASALWVIDFMYTCALGGAVGVNFHGGINLNYTAIVDSVSNGVDAVQSVRPMYYGMLMFALAGQGTLYSTTVSPGNLNLSAYAVKTSAGLSIVIVNKDLSTNADVTLTLPQVANTTSIVVMTQGSGSPSLSATSGVTIQGSGVSASAGFTPSTAYTATSGTGTETLTVYVPYLSAILVQIT